MPPPAPHAAAAAAAPPHATPALPPSDLERALLRHMGRAIGEHQLIADGDRIMVAVSGGKDSYALLHLLRALQRRAPVRFELIAVHVDQGHPGYDGAPLRAWLEREGHAYEVLREDTYSVVTEKIPEGKTYCSLCSRLRRGILYTTAARLGCTKIALGHHRDDALETLLLNLFFAGKLASMPARLTSDDGAHVVIRPLIYAAEEQLERFALEREFPILPCNLCGSQSQAQRKQIKSLLGRLEAEHPGMKQTMLAALGNVNPSHLLDRELNAQLADARASRAGAAAAAWEGATAEPGTSCSPRRHLPLAKD